MHDVAAMALTDDRGLVRSCPVDASKPPTKGLHAPPGRLPHVRADADGFEGNPVAGHPVVPLVTLLLIQRRALITPSWAV